MGALNINSVSLGGRLVKEPILTETAKKIPVCNLLLAINHRDTVDFIEVSVYDSLAKKVADRSAKGTTVYIKGRVTYIKGVEKLKLIAEEVQFIKEDKKVDNHG